MELSIIERLLSAGPWAGVVITVVPSLVVLTMFILALRGVPPAERAEVIRAMAELVRALWRTRVR